MREHSGSQVQFIEFYPSNGVIIILIVPRHSHNPLSNSIDKDAVSSYVN